MSPTQSRPFLEGIQFMSLEFRIFGGFGWIQDREDARSIAGVAAATPKFDNLLYKLSSEFFPKNSY